MRPKIFLTLTLIISSFSTNVIVQQSDFIKDYLERLENSKQYLLLLAEEMPEDKYDFKSTPE